MNAVASRLGSAWPEAGAATLSSGLGRRCTGQLPGGSDWGSGGKRTTLLLAGAAGTSVTVNCRRPLPGAPLAGSPVGIDGDPTLADASGAGGGVSPGPSAGISAATNTMGSNVPAGLALGS